MKDQYIAYKKVIDGTSFYFIKHLLIFPEFKNTEPVQVGFGMHRVFERACALAGITDIEIQKQIFPAEVNTESEAKVINLNEYHLQKGIAK